MSDYINIKQYDEMNVTAKDDRILYDVSHTNGVIEGCEITYSGGNTIHIGAGYGVIKGALFEILEHDVTVTLSESGTLQGQIYIHFDLSAETVIDIISESASSLTPMTQNEDANFINGVYDIQLCTFTVNTTTLSNLLVTFPMVLGASDFQLEFVGKTTHFNNDGSIRYSYPDGRYVIQDFPAGAITRQRLYAPSGTLIATKTTTSDSSTGDIIDTVVKE